MWRSLLWVVAISLTVGVGYVAVDTARRAATLGVFFEGHGMPTNSPPEAFKAAEFNVIYLLGLTVGVAAGIGVSVATVAWWRLTRSRRPKGTPAVVSVS